MTAIEIARQKYQRLMSEIEELEDQIDALQQQTPSPDRLRQLEPLQEKLGAHRSELARLSDGCGTPHTR